MILVRKPGATFRGSCSVPGINDGNAGAAALRSLVHGVDRHEHCRVADRSSRHPADRRLGMTVVMHVGIVEHDLPPATQSAAPVRLAFHEAVDDTAIEIRRTRS